MRSTSPARLVSVQLSAVASRSASIRRAYRSLYSDADLAEDYFVVEPIECVV